MLSVTMAASSEEARQQMIYLVAKAALSGLIIAAVSDIAKRSPAFGALIISLPLLSILAVIWLWRDTGDTERIAALMFSTFWYVLPSLPMFLVMPALLRNGSGSLRAWLSPAR
jgi:hypothetical protein